MYVHRSGFRLPNEPMATHMRRRLRLTPSQNPDPNLPQPDASLWIMHYSQTDQQSQIPSRSIRVSDQVRHIMNERLQLQRHGQLIRKEFMLRDSASWPTINLPGHPTPAYPQQAMGYPNDVMAHMNRGQQQAYLHQQQVNGAQRGIGPSPAKRPRYGGPVAVHGSQTVIPAPIIPQDLTNEDEDGTVGGDYMDHLTPRDISLHRYTQHHDWLVEILGSPYDTTQIIPGDLGLGRKGELESLTRDFFEAPIDGTPKEVLANTGPKSKGHDAPPPPRVGRLEAGKAEDFTKCATEKVAQINLEMERLKRQHARRMAKLNRSRALKEPEQSLRAETLEMINGDTSKSSTGQDDRTNKIALEVFGKGVKVDQDVDCIQKGGLEEKSEMRNIEDQDYDMVDTFNLEVAFDQAQSQMPATSTAHDPQTNNNNSAAIQTPQSQASQHQTSRAETNQVGDQKPATEPRKDSVAEDWIMVNRDTEPPTEDQTLGDLDSFVNDAAMQSATGTPNALDEPIENRPQTFDSTGAGNTENPSGENFAESAEEEVAPGATAVSDHTADFGTNGFGEGIDFGDLDTAGDELSGYAERAENPDMEDHGDMGTNESAFGAAFAAGMENDAS